MAYTPTYPSKINWQNEPSEATALNDVNLNKMDDAIYTIDQRVVELDTAREADETILANKVEKVTGKGLSQVDNVEVTVGTTEGTQIGSIKTTNVDGSQTNRGLYNGVVVDSALSDSSTNPVQNQVVKSAIDAKSTVAISDTLADGTILANITIDGTTTAIKGSDIDVDDELSPTSTNPVENKAIYDALNNLLPSKTVSGNPIAISDASGFNAKALTVSMNPIQDLHGYSNPWAGGAGKNKLPYWIAPTTGALNITVNSDGSVRIYGTASGTGQNISANIMLDSPLVDFSGVVGLTNNTPERIRVFTLNQDETQLGLFDISANTSSKTFSQPGSIYGFRFYFSTTSGQSYDFTIKPQIESGTTVTDFAPYSNICPISGRSSVEVVDRGENYIEFPNINTTNFGISYNSNGNKMKIQGTATNTSAPWAATYSNNYANMRLGEFPAGHYRLKIFGFNSQLAGATGSRITFTARYSDNSLVSNNVYATGEDWIELNAINPFKCDFWLTVVNGDTIDCECEVLMLNYDEYETHTHQYSETIYGGVDDFVNGELTDEYDRVNLGSLSWVKAGSGVSERFQASLTNPLLPPTNNVPFEGVSECYPSAPWTYFDSAGHNYFMALNSSANLFAIRNTSYSDADTFKNSVNGLYLCYKKATPTTISTSAEEITLLKGNNVLSTNADDMELKYSVSLDSLLP